MVVDLNYYHGVAEILKDVTKALLCVQLWRKMKLKQKYSNKGLGKIIALIALFFLGKAYANGYGAMDYENVTYKFESIYPDIRTMDIIEKDTPMIRKELQ